MHYRPFAPKDREAAFRLFRESIHAYMLGLGMVDAHAPIDYDGNWRRQQDLYRHLEQTAAEDWVAQDDDGALVGWARSVERDGHLQLTHFFVAPGTQGAGVGRQLLHRAFPPGRGRQRSIIATTSPGALSLYLRHGVDYQCMAFSFIGRPQARADDEGDLRIERVQPAADTLDRLVEIDAQVLGFRRAVDLEYFMCRQPVYLAWRADCLAGYAFGSDGLSSGPAAALRPQDLPALLRRVEASACDAGVDELLLMIPARAADAVNWALTSGYRIDPFYEVLLANTPMQLDRYLLTDSTFTW